MFSDNFGEKEGGHYMCLVGEKRVAFRENDSFPIKLMERRRPQQTRTENDYQQPTNQQQTSNADAVGRFHKT